jgi:hypothetical protein
LNALLFNGDGMSGDIDGSLFNGTGMSGDIWVLFYSMELEYVGIFDFSFY